MKKLIILILTLQVMDIITTLFIIRHGGVELNTLTTSLVHSSAYVPIKLLPAVMITPIPYIISKKPKIQKFFTIGLVVVIVLMVLVVSQNTIQIILH